MVNVVMDASQARDEQAPLARGQIMMVRSWLLGMPLRAMAVRYLPTDPDTGEPASEAAILKEIIRWRDRLCSQAHLIGDVDMASCIRQGPDQPQYSLQIALDGLAKLERAIQAKPALSHGVGVWFSPVLAARLTAAGVATIGDLLVRIEDRGAAWWRTTPKIGAKAADVIAIWVKNHQDELGCKALMESYAPSPPPPRAAGANQVLVLPFSPVLPPFEAMKLPTELDGSRGYNRANMERCRIAAGNDYQAIRTWLDRYRDKPHTWRAYRKEAERFLLWSIVERGKSMSDCLGEDVIAFRDFLAKLAPLAKELNLMDEPTRALALATQGRWCGPMVARWSPAWKPFQGRLSAASRKQALVILKAMFDWLVGQRYLDFNPFDALPRQRAAGKMQIDKALSKEMWAAVVANLEKRCTQPEDGQARAVWPAILLLRDSGLRRDEACRALRGDLKFAKGGGTDGWELTVLGKGEKIREVPVTARTVEALKAHWKDRNLDFDSIMVDDIPLLSPLPRQMKKLEKLLEKRNLQSGANAGFSPEGLHNLITREFKKLAQIIGSIEGERLEGKRAHALRHTFGAHAVASGMDLDVVQGILGHASLNTTTIYVQSGNARKRRQIKKMEKMG